VQVKSWWAFDAALTASGSVRIWKPALDQMGAAWGTKQVELDQLPGGDAGALARGGEIQRYTWTMEGVEPLVLPELPDRGDGGTSQPTFIVQISAGDQFLIGLTNGGHVVRMDFRPINDSEGLATLREQNGNM